MRKPRSDSVLDNLPLHQQDALIAWLVEDRMDEEEALERLKAEFGVESSATALNNFWHRYCAPRLLRRSADAAEAFGENAGGLGTDWSGPSKALIRQKFFELSAARRVDPKDLLAFAQMVTAIDQGELEREKLKTRRQETAVRTRLKRRDQALGERKVRLLEQRENKAKETLGETALSSAEKERRLREIFGITTAAP